MTAFSIVALLLTAGALLFVLTPLLRKEVAPGAHGRRDEVNLAVLRDQSRELDADLATDVIDAPAYDSARRELETRVAEDVPAGAPAAVPAARKRWAASVVALAVPILVVSLYFSLGNPKGLDPANVAAPKDRAHAVTAAQIESMNSQLAARVKAAPNDVNGWAMLARSYHGSGRFGAAADAYAHVVQLVPGDANVLADYADVLALTQNKSLQGEPEKWIARALLVDPKNLKALSLSGSAAFERRDDRVAVLQWEKILAIVPADSDLASSIADGIREAKTRAAEPTAEPTMR